jgi:hypothetical protein
MVTKALGLWLLVVALLWGLWMFLSMTTPVLTALPLPLYYALGFGGPLLLLIGSTLVMEMRHSKLASIVCLLACAWFTLEFSPLGIALLKEARQIPDCHISLLMLVLVIFADTAAVLVFRHVRKAI